MPRESDWFHGVSAELRLEEKEQAVETRRRIGRTVRVGLLEAVSELCVVFFVRMRVLFGRLYVGVSRLRLEAGT